MPADITALVDDLVAERAELTQVLAALSEQQWLLSCPTQQWTIADQVGHLAFFDEATALSIVDPATFAGERDAFVARGTDFPDQIVEELRGKPGSELLAWLTTAQASLVEAYRAVDPATRLPWFGPAMSPASSVTARIMETWAHGQDVVDALGITRVPTERLRHIAHIGVGALKYSYAVNDVELPADPIRVDIAAPGGGTWSWGPEDAADRVTGTALDFCLVVTQRRNLADTALVVSGPTATQWISIAQSFAGAAGTGRAPQAEWSSR